MKLRNLVAVCLSVVAFTAVSALSVNAQENGNRDENGKIVRGPYETNGAGGNWFIGVAGGINILEDGWFKNTASDHKSGVAFDLDFNVGKWFTPSVGARLGYQGMRTNAWNKTANPYTSGSSTSKGYKEKIDFAYVHGDVLWNVSNSWSGYKETRFWNFIPYLSAGWLHGWGVSGSGAPTSNQFALGGGLLNNLRLSNRVNLTIDLRELIFKDSYYGKTHGTAGMFSATVGISVNLGKTNWKRATVIPDGYATYNISEIEALKAQLAKCIDTTEALTKENGNLKKDNKDLTDENEELKAKLANCKGMVDVTTTAAFFQIGQTKLTSVELEHVDFYVKTIVESDPNAKFVLTGYADKDTGGRQRNQYLSEKRVEYVANLLKNEYNVAESRLEVKAVGCDVTYSPNGAELNRCVSIEYVK